MDYMQQFGEVYEFALNYVQSLKRRLAISIQYYKVSENSIDERIEKKARQAIARSTTVKYTQMYANALIERQVLEAYNILKAEQENAHIMKGLWNNHYDQLALKFEIERLKAQLPIKLKSMREIHAKIDELNNW